MIIEKLKISTKNELLVDIENMKLGHKTALMGRSGAGKSLIASALLGEYANNLQVEIKGLNLQIHPSRSKLTQKLYQGLFARKSRANIAAIMQNPRTAFDPLFSIKEHFEETCKDNFLSDKNLIKKSCKDAHFDLELLNRYPHELSGGQLQRAMIAIALLLDVQLLIADEPTSDLDAICAKEILELLRDLPKDILLITHDHAAAEFVCDHCVMIASGKIVEQGDLSILKHPQSSQLRALADARHQLDAAVKEFKTRLKDDKFFNISAQKNKKIISVKNLSFSYGQNELLHHLDFSLYQQRHCAILGLSGCGKSTFAKILANLLCAKDGQIQTTNVHIVFQDSRASFNPTWSIKKALNEASKDDHLAACNAFSLHIKDENMLLSRLSGGELARLSLARASLSKAPVLILDEATSALDTQTTCEIISALKRLSEGEFFAPTLILITHDIRVAAALANDIYVCKDGRLSQDKEDFEPFFNALL